MSAAAAKKMITPMSVGRSPISPTSSPAPRAPSAAIVRLMALPAQLSLVDTDRLLYGSDYPFTPDWVASGLAEALAGTDVLTDDDRVLLSRGNAASLFPRLA